MSKGKHTSQFPEFTRSTLPDPRGWEDTTILVIEESGARTMLFSDGRTWSPVGGGGVAVQAGTQTRNTGTVSFANSNGVSFGMDSDGRMTVSVAGTVAAGAASIVVSAGGNSHSDSRVLFGTTATPGAVTFGLTGSTVTAAAPHTMGVYASSQTTGGASSATADMRSLTFVGAGNVSVGMQGASVVVSGAGGAGGGVLLAADTRTATTAGSVLFSNANGVSFGLNAVGGSVMTASVAAQSNQTLSVRATGNTTVNSAGTMDARSMLFSAAGAVSMGVTGNTVHVSVAAGAQSNQTLGVYAIGNTTGAGSSSTYDARTLNMSVAGLLSAGWSGNSLVLSSPETTSFNPMSVGFSTQGNTGGNTGWGSERVHFVGVGDVTLVGSTNAGSMTISISAAGGGGGGGATLSRYQWPVNAGSMTGSLIASDRFSFQHLSVLQNIHFSRVDLPLYVLANSTAASHTAAIGLSAMMVLYTRNGSTFNPIAGASGSSTFTWASSNSNWRGVGGGHALSFPIASTLTPGEYWAGYYVQTVSGLSVGANTTALNCSFSVLAARFETQTAVAEFGVDFSNSSNRLIQGLRSSLPGATSETVQWSQLTCVGDNPGKANVPLHFRNY